MRPVLRVFACILCFGMAGVIWSLPWLRRRRLARAERCHVCAVHRRWRIWALCTLGLVLAAGSLARLQTALDPQIRCHAHIADDGTVQPEPLLEIAPPEPWATTRSVVVAPISGVGVLSGWALDMESCAGPPLLVMFWPPPRTSGGGSTFGDVFVAWMPPRGSTDAARGDGYGIVNEERYLRYGPNISQRRVSEAELGLHESRHVDQWAVGTILAGPLAFPAAYAIDGTIFPGSRNHFERDADLQRGGYPASDGTGPAPQWPQSAVLLLGGLLIWRRRLRWLVRVATGGVAQRWVHALDRCPVHSQGWRARPAAEPAPKVRPRHRTRSV